MTDKKIVRRNDIIFGSVQGAALVADAAYREGCSRQPAVVSVHGGRWVRGTRFDDGTPGHRDNGVILIDDWAADGFFALRIDYRLVTCTPAPACYQDVLCAIRWVHAHADVYGIDRDRIFLVGQSAGAHMVALAATLGPDAFESTGGWEEWPSSFAAGICVAGAYNLKTLDWGSGWCPPGQTWDAARTFASPLAHVEKGLTPLLIIHAEDDKSVPVAQADEFVSSLRSQGKLHDYRRYAEGGHLKLNNFIVRDCRAFIESLDLPSSSPGTGEPQ